MQKTTVFTIFFSVLVVTLLAEFLTNTQLQNGWTSVIPPNAIKDENAPAANTSDPFSTPGGGLTADAATTAGQTLQPSVLPTSPSIVAGDSLVPASTAPAASLDAPPPVAEVPKSEVSSFLDTSSYKIEKISEQQLIQMGFEGMHLERVSAEGLLFQLLDLSDAVNLSKVRFHLTDGKNVYGVVSEYLLADNTRAKAFYENLRQKASLYAPAVKLNETNSFGTTSFYLNDSKRLGTAFLTVLSGNRVYSFSYPKASHEFFKKFIEFLMV